MIECVPSTVATQISQSVSIPVIGIGAGADTDAQVLVLHDMLGLNDKPAKFVKNFMEGQSSIESAIKEYVKAVKKVLSQAKHINIFRKLIKHKGR